MNPKPGPDVRQAEAAHICARAAWLYPADTKQREAAIAACHVVGVDYLAAVAVMMEEADADPHTARRLVAEGLRQAADRWHAREAPSQGRYTA